MTPFLCLAYLAFWCILSLEACKYLENSGGKDDFYGILCFLYLILSPLTVMIAVFIGIASLAS